ncbi:beta-lactamase/transpeptidase-like protein [Plenodomus tracheiphilus IPT5]|uniref:Beta-lactamase/transpeptidase-like protein n=1 Tax=Plenodomus tracheiphilus IPT5 TaxID=1408161 RepID=A0A6A7BIW9_9PLEO|nr:beta-lactamase/transpeptidase-like protein [Plenodomus tracheiphilus IPT5]
MASPINKPSNSPGHHFKVDKQPISPVTLGAINKDGSFHYTQALGNKPNDDVGPDTLYWLASSTKIVTTIAVMQCVERGQISLNDDIASLLPEWKDPKILTGFTEENEAIYKPATKAITLRHLLTHSSGMAYVFMDPLMSRYQELQENQPPRVTRSVAEKFPQDFLIFEPGERFMYSPAIDWAGLLVERITNMKLGAYMQTHIFDIVGARDATFHLEQREGHRVRKAKNWERVGESGVQEQEPPYYVERLEPDFGGGGLFATVNDLLKIYQGVLSGRLLRSETARLMFQPQLENAKGLDDPAEYSVPSRNAIWNSIPDDVPVDFGIGGVVNTAAVPKRRGVNSLTWSGLPNCYWWIDFNNGVAGVYLSQLVPTGDEKAVKLLADFEEFVYSSLDE